MNQISLSSAQRIVAQVNYTKRRAEKPAVYLYATPEPVPSIDRLRDPHFVAIANARPLQARLSLDVEGFGLIDAPTRMRDFDDVGQRKAIYDAEVAALIKAATGASHVQVFDHTIRRLSHDNSSAESRAPVHNVHNDYTETSGPRRLRDLLGEVEAAAVTQTGRRFAIVNLWRSIAGTVIDTPLAFAAADSVALADLIATDLKYPDRTGEIYRVGFSTAHRWFYVPMLRADEALLIKSYDSATDGRARFTPHTAFDYPATLPGTAKRQSIESRVLVVF